MIDILDNLNIVHPKSLEFLDESFDCDLNFVGRDRPTIISLNGVPVLTKGNMFMLVSPPGTGKSNVCEALVAKALNHKCDGLGFDVLHEHDKKILLVDTERTKEDILRGYKRIMWRADPNKEDLFLWNNDKTRLRHLKMVGYRQLDQEQYLEHLEYHLSSGDYYLALIDQSADFVNSVNKEDEVKLFVKKLEYLSEKHDIGIVITIHPNPKDTGYKPTGWLGSFLHKKCESVFASYKTENNERLITTDFPHGKVRNGSDILDTAFSWDEEKKMFMSCDVASAKVKKTKRDENDGHLLDDLIRLLFMKKEVYTTDELIEAIKEQTTSTKIKLSINEERLLSYANKYGIITLFNNYWHLNNNDKMDEVPF